jgi:hypothetical protein
MPSRWMTKVSAVALVFSQRTVVPNRIWVVAAGG